MVLLHSDTLGIRYILLAAILDYCLLDSGWCGEHTDQYEQPWESSRCDHNDSETRAIVLWLRVRRDTLPQYWKRVAQYEGKNLWYLNLWGPYDSETTPLMAIVLWGDRGVRRIISSALQKSRLLLPYDRAFVVLASKQKHTKQKDNNYLYHLWGFWRRIHSTLKWLLLIHTWFGF